jgi:peptide/nickel transport system ATP-binding protein/oligopeptide transport system ATP-binding protein
MNEVAAEAPLTHAFAHTQRAGVGDVLLDVKDLRTHFHVMDGIVKAVDGVSFSLRRGGRLALVGESGCGKSVTALTIMRLIDTPPGKIAGGEIIFDGRDLLKLRDKEIRAIRGGEIAMIFQEPMTSLNPVLTVGSQILEAILLHQKVSKKEALEIAAEALVEVGINDPKRRLDQYPFELSGGMRQRVMIAMALSCKPKLIIADEPTTALDVTIQRQILELIKSIQERTGTALLLITHDLGVVAETVDDVAVMYAGRVVETGTVEEVLLEPQHPYTRGLLESIPSQGKKGQRLAAIKGVVPNPLRMPVGCKFEPRCPYAFTAGAEEEPPLIQTGDGRHARCWLYDPRYADHLAMYEGHVKNVPAGGVR